MFEVNLRCLGWRGWRQGLISSLCECLFINSLILQIFQCLSLPGTVWYFCSCFSFNSQFYIVLKSLAPFQPVSTLSWRDGGDYAQAPWFLQDGLVEIRFWSLLLFSLGASKFSSSFLILISVVTGFIFLLIVFCILEYMWHLESVGFWGHVRLIQFAQKCATEN